MKAQRIRWWEYAIAIVIGLVLGVAVSVFENRGHLALTGAPWPVSAVMVVIGLIIVYMAWQVHRYATAEPRRRARMKRIDPQRAVDTLVFAKALALAGALLLGWYGGQIAMAVGHIEASYYRTVVVECAIAAGASLLDMVLGIISEGLCQLPPTEGPEHPRIKERRQQGLA